MTTTDSPTIGQALARQWPLILLSVLAFGALGGLAGKLREPVYTAEARLSVGRLSLSVQSVPGFAVGGEIVASGYARSVDVPEVIDPVARQLRRSPESVRSRVSATNVPDSPLFDLFATGDSEDEAVELANAMARSVVAYGKRGDASPERSESLLGRYREAVLRRTEARQRVSRLVEADASDASIASARADAEAEELRVRSASEAYQESQRTEVTGGVVEALAPARTASSDERATLQGLILTGLLAGGVLGAGLALLRSARERRRQA